MIESIVTGANQAVTTGLQLYYDHAGHRQISPSDMRIEDPQVIAPDGNIVFLRGLLGFEPSEVFANAFRAAGFRFKTHRFPKTLEDNKFRQWPCNAADLLKEILENPDYLGNNPVLLGHSAGGLEMVPLKALALRKDPGAILKVLGFDQKLGVLLMNDSRVARAISQLEKTIFIAAGSPLLGVALTLPGQLANRVIVESTVPGLLSSMTQETVQRAYETMGIDRHDLVDSVVYSDTAPLDLQNNGPTSLATHAAVQGAYRLFSPFLKRSKPHDGIVPVHTARLPWSERERFLREIKVPFDHLGMVEYKEAAHLIIGLILSLQFQNQDLNFN